MRRRTLLGSVVGVASTGCLRLTEEPVQTSRPGENESARDDAGGQKSLGDGDNLSPSSSWPQFQFDAGNTGVGPASRVPESEPDVRWERERSTPSRGGLVASTDYIIDRRRAGFVAIEKATGDVGWRTSDTLVDEFFLNCDPVVAGSLLVFVGRNKRTMERGVVALDAESGEQAWSLQLTSADEFFHGLTLHNDVLYVLGRNNDTNVPLIRAVSLDERSVRWTHEIEAYDHVNRPVAANGDVVVFGGYAEYERTGSEPSNDDTPGGVTALDAATGDVDWRAEVGGTQMPVTIAGDRVIATPDRSKTEHAALQDGGPYPLMALDLTDGSVRWSYKAQNSFYNSPAVTQAHVYFGFGDTLWAVDVTDGRPVWKRSIDRHVDSQSPIVLDGTVVIGDFNFEDGLAFVNAFDAASGEHRWSHEITEERLATILGVDDGLFLKAHTFAKEDSVTVRGLW